MNEKSNFGVLDWLDTRAGRVSDNDAPNGQRKRSWGATVFLLCSLPMAWLTLSTGCSQILVASSLRASSKALVAYRECLQKDAKKAHLCKFPTLQKTNNPSLDLGKWPWVIVLAVFWTGAFFALIRRHQDFMRLKESAQLMSVFVSNNKEIPDLVMQAFQAASSKTLGVSETSIVANPKVQPETTH